MKADQTGNTILIGTQRPAEYNSQSSYEEYRLPVSGFSTEHRGSMARRKKDQTDKLQEPRQGNQRRNSEADNVRNLPALQTHMYDYAPVGYVIMNIHGDICYANPAAAFFLADTPMSLRGKNFAELIAEHEGPVLLDYLQQSARQDKSLEIDVHIKLRDKELSARMVSRVVTDNNEPLLRVMFIDTSNGAFASASRTSSKFDLKAAVQDIQQEIETIRLTNQQQQQKEPELKSRKSGQQEQELLDEKGTGNIEPTKHELQKELESKSIRLTSILLKEVRTYEYIASWEKKVKKALVSPPSRMRKLLSAILHDIQQNLHDHLHPLERHMSETNQQFLAKLSGRHPDLTPAELKLCCLLRLNLSSKEIARLLHTSEKTVENQRYRLRRKFGLKHGKNLTSFLFGL